MSPGTLARLASWATSAPVDSEPVDSDANIRSFAFPFKSNEIALIVSRVSWKVDVGPRYLIVTKLGMGYINGYLLEPIVLGTTNE